jgi:hypothetical protein
MADFVRDKNQAVLLICKEAAPGDCHPDRLAAAPSLTADVQHWEVDEAGPSPCSALARFLSINPLRTSKRPGGPVGGRVRVVAIESRRKSTRVNKSTTHPA